MNRERYYTNYRNAPSPRGTDEAWAWIKGTLFLGILLGAMRGACIAWDALHNVGDVLQAVLR